MPDSIPFTAQFVRIPGGNCLMGDQFEYIDLKHYTDELDSAEAILRSKSVARELVGGRR